MVCYDFKNYWDSNSFWVFCHNNFYLIQISSSGGNSRNSNIASHKYLAFIWTFACKINSFALWWTPWQVIECRPIISCAVQRDKNRQILPFMSWEMPHSYECAVCHLPFYVTGVRISGVPPSYPQKIKIKDFFPHITLVINSTLNSWNKPFEASIFAFMN